MEILQKPLICKFKQSASAAIKCLPEEVDVVFLNKLVPVDLFAAPKPMLVVPNPADVVGTFPKPPNMLLPAAFVVLPKPPNRLPEDIVEPDPKEPNPICKKNS